MLHNLVSLLHRPGPPGTYRSPRLLDSSMTRSFTSSDKYPTLYQILFSPHTPYVPPHASPIAMFVWKQRIWVESTFCLVSLEPWEKYLVGQHPIIYPLGFVDLGFACVITCSCVPPHCVCLYNLRGSGHISNILHPWIQAGDRLPPRHDDASKHHIPYVMNNDLRWHTDLS